MVIKPSTGKQLVDEGALAYAEGKSPDEDCPYTPISSERAAKWRIGWYDARTRDRLGHVFDKWNIPYP